MKTSNKLLIGFFGLVLIGMIIYNFALTKEINKGSKSNSMMNNFPQQDSLLIDVDSIALKNSANTQK